MSMEYGIMRMEYGYRVMPLASEQNHSWAILYLLIA